MLSKRKAWAALGIALAGLYLVTKRERSRRVRGYQPSILKYAALLLPGWKAHKVKCSDSGPDSAEMVILDSDPNGGISPHKTVVMLHGFPDNALYFHKVATALVRAGYRVILPSLPGYDSSSVTASFKDKHLKRIASDILNALKTINIKRFHLVGHDWGSGIAAQMSISDKGYGNILTLTQSAVPYNTLFGFSRFPNQFRYSWYFTLFQLPLIPEFWISKLGGLRWIWKSWSPNITLDESDPFWQSVQDTFNQPGVTGDSINYYRKNLGQGSIIGRTVFPFAWLLAYVVGMSRKRQQQDAPVEEFELQKFFNKERPPLNIPVLALIGENDGCFFPPLVRFVYSDNGGGKILFPAGCSCKTISGAGHFSFIEQPEQVSETLLDFFATVNQQDRTSSI